MIDNSCLDLNWITVHCLGDFIIPFWIFRIPGRHKGQGRSNSQEVPKLCVRRLHSSDATERMSFSLKPLALSLFSEFTASLENFLSPGGK